MDKGMELLNEINQRVTRTESRIVQLGDFVGANLRAKQKIEVIYGADSEVYVAVDALDVSFSRVASVLRDAGYDRGSFEIIFKNASVGTVDMSAINSVKEG